MMKSVSIGMLALVLVAASALVAHAGGGAGSGVNTTLLDCYAIQGGDNSPYVLEVEDQFGVSRIRVNKARFVCTPTAAATVVKGPALNGDFDPNAADHLKCYGVTVRQPQPDPVVQISDPFGVETANVAQDRLLCAPAIKEVVAP